jgi:hypothetical protein
MALDHRPRPECCESLEKKRRKKFRRFTRRNPLKSLDSDEGIQEIQGNPTLISQAFAAKRPLAKKTQTEILDQCRRLKY